MFMLGGLDKSSFLAVLRPHIFFDDQDHHAGPAAAHVPSVMVPYRAGASAPDLAGAKILGAPAPVPLIAEAAARPAS